MPSHSAIITAGGIGQRMYNNIPKQFIELGRIPILMHVIKAFYIYSKDIQIIVTLPENHFDSWYKLTEKHCFEIPTTIVKGGETRYHSISNALHFVKNSDLLAIHDGVRPFISTEMINNGFTKAQNFSSAIPIISATDSIRMKKNDYLTFINRNLIYSVQTPQCFDTKKLLEAYSKGYKVYYTDDAMVFEKTHGKLNFYDGIPENIKITNPQDVVIAEAIFSHLSNNPLFPHLRCK